MKEIEQILGDLLPAGVYQHKAWWGNDITNHPHYRAWMGYGYHAVYVRDTIRKGYVQFEKQSKKIKI